MISFEEWMAMYVQLSEELLNDLNGMFPLDSKSELESILRPEYEAFMASQILDL